MNSELAQLTERLGRVEPRGVSVGYMTLQLFEPGQLESEQVGYSRDAAGDDLTDTAVGAWRRHWIVIGREDMCGDPIFTDVSDSDLPVFTAVHGGGSWEPTLLATSFAGFIAGLRLVSEIGAGRSNPVQLEEHPLTDLEKTNLLEGLCCLGEGADVDFWTNWFEIAG
jgi:hypothetical protein